MLWTRIKHISKPEDETTIKNETHFWKIKQSEVLKNADFL